VLAHLYVALAPTVRWVVFQILIHGEETFCGSPKQSCLQNKIGSAVWLSLSTSSFLWVQLESHNQLFTGCKSYPHELLLGRRAGSIGVVAIGVVRIEVVEDCCMLSIVVSERVSFDQRQEKSTASPEDNSFSQYHQGLWVQALNLF
jgi:hypothetical protein